MRDHEDQNKLPEFVHHPSWIIPGFGCCSKDSKGLVCAGDDSIDYDKFCGQCYCLYTKNIFN